MKLQLTYAMLMVAVIAARSSSAQVMLGRTVISPIYLNGSAGGVDFYSTLGQPADATLNVDTLYLTQGFEQPLDKSPISVEWDATFDVCLQQYSVVIHTIDGCTSLNDATITWNGAAGDSSFTTQVSSALLIVNGPVGCYFSAVLDLSEAERVNLNCEPAFYNYISPNGDNLNDAWVIVNIDQEEYSENEVRIFNRWGEEVWSASNYDNQDVVFTGSGSSGPLPDGTYFYIVRFGDIEYSGYLELQR